jgi:GH25 family lysozyme M1 (1,4-beta-N-acetylmuramidase)
VKATEGPHPDGATYNNESYGQQLENAKAAGMVAGAYHYLVEGPVKRQVSNFLSVVRDPSGLLLMIDYEAYNNYPQLSPTEQTLNDFIAELKSRVGAHPILLYSGSGYWDSPPANGPVTDERVVTWDAMYPSSDTSSPGPKLYGVIKDGGWGERWGGREPMFWQFSGSTPVANVAQVDVNAFRGTREQLLALTGAEGREYWVGFTVDRGQWMRGVSVPDGAWIKPTRSGGKVWLELVPPGATPAGTEYQAYGWVGFAADQEQRMRGVNVPDGAWIGPTEQSGKVWLELVSPA